MAQQIQEKAHKKKTVRPKVSQGFPINPNADVSRYVNVLHEISQLSEPHKQILVKTYVMGESEEDIALQDKVTPNTVKRRLLKAFNNLATLSNVQAPNNSNDQEEWTKQQELRRCELIDKEIDDSLTSKERKELKFLQQRMLSYRRRIAPLPIDVARDLHSQMMEVLRTQ